MLFVLALLLMAGAQTSIQIPDARFRLAARPTVENQVEGGLHFIELSCTSGACSLTTIALNECRYSGITKTMAFSPASERSVSEMLGSVSRVEYEFGYDRLQARGAQLTLASFVGRFTRNGRNRIRVEYERLKGNLEIPLDCPVRLPGLQ